MAVTSMLALAPLIRNNLIDTDHIVVDSKIGSSGAGSGSGTAHAMRAGLSDHTNQQNIDTLVKLNKN